ncbi:MAG: lysoplasmalogenase [Planctomycetes bacterium]|nr:lysoplasmalogenase [Planctomycetota bacterium]
MISPTAAFLPCVGLPVAAAAIAYVVAEARGARRGMYATKPLPVCLLLFALFSLGSARDETRRALLAAGLLFSLAGDVFLMLPADRFLAGLASFLVAHLCYVAAFFSGAPAASVTASLPYAAGYLAFAAGVLALLWPGLGTLKLPVAAYVAAICAMCTGAVARGHADHSLLAPIGATLFLLSDGVLAVNRFRFPFAAARPLLFFLYVAGQCFITASAYDPG